jgi:hypothetical protein
MDTDVVQILRSRDTPPETEARIVLPTCSLCLRVHHGSEWVDAELLIRKLRSYELEAPPRLESAVCDFCADAIMSRRARVAEQLAA